MKLKSCVFLKVLLSHYHQGINAALLSSLPQEESAMVLNQHIQNPNPKISLRSPEDILKPIHYSWLAPLIQQLPASLQSTAVGSLSPEQMTGLQQMLHITEPLHAVTSIAKTYLARMVCNKAIDSDLLPIEYLPPSEMKALAQCSKKQLVDLIDFLGLYDLADEVRRMLNTAKLKNIYLCLTPKELQFLRMCLHQKEKLVIPQMGLEQWNGEQKELHKLIHQKGLFRLGKALCGEHPDLFWHITHVLDTGRAAVINNYYEAAPVAGVTSILQSQAVNVLNFLAQEQK